MDDEPLAQNLLEKFINKVPFLSLEGKFDNAIEAVDGILKIKPDVVFLDISMPEMTGIEFIQSLTGYKPHIIITTAFPQYALEGYEHNVVDYLLKPIAFSRFFKAIQKVSERSHINRNLPVGFANTKETIINNTFRKPQNNKERFFMVKTDRKLVKVNMDEIVYVEGMKDYIKIHTLDQLVIAHMTMTKISELLPASQFIRINRSFIISIESIKLTEGNWVETSSGKKLTIGIKYRDAVKETFNSWTVK